MPADLPVYRNISQGRGSRLQFYKAVRVDSWNRILCSSTKDRCYPISTIFSRIFVLANPHLKLDSNEYSSVVLGSLPLIHMLKERDSPYTGAEMSSQKFRSETKLLAARLTRALCDAHPPLP